ncbi:hypothetical protein SO802_005905 [Lithocarpus litseifolius]|uniref:Aminotransferase-like plant mobile domain-containing protein n=1 Tax=Lithocarpus litseifolius TaxID=425828 RepID=A0AAW2DJT9_9ROSI
MLGVLKCRRRSYSLPQGGQDPQITCYIIEAGLEGLFKVPKLEVDHALITALVERWHPETHTFHLPHGEMGITLQDIEVMLGVPVDGLHVVRKTKLNWSALCTQLLGYQPPDPIPHHNEIKSILAGFLNLINDVKKYSWSSAALAWLYRHQCKALEMKAMQIGGAVMLVLLWVYSRFPLICPITRPPQQQVQAGPLLIGEQSNTKATRDLFHAIQNARKHRQGKAQERAIKFIDEITLLDDEKDLSDFSNSSNGDFRKFLLTKIRRCC